MNRGMRQTDEIVETSLQPSKTTTRVCMGTVTSMTQWAHFVSLVSPKPSTKNLCLIQPLGIWHAPSNMVWESSMWDGNLYHQNVIDPHWNY
jgi:hypothetical protein